MTEALLTALGLILGVVATLVGLLHEEKPSMARRILLLLALVGLGAGLFTTHLQYKERNAANTEQRNAEAQQAIAVARLHELQDKVGTLAQVQTAINTKTGDLTMLNELGGGEYYVVIATFKRNSVADDKDFKQVWDNVLTLYPKAKESGLLWKAPEPNHPSKYELRFGRNLTPSSAQIFQSLADRGLANGHAIIRRE